MLHSGSGLHLRGIFFRPSALLCFLARASMPLLIGSAAKYEQGKRVVASKDTIQGPLFWFCSASRQPIERSLAQPSRDLGRFLFRFVLNVCLYAS